MQTPKSERIHIGIFGRTNVGKSSLINLITGQNVSIISEIAGTTTDLVEKTMELAPIGPIVLLDTAGIDDITELGKKRQNVTAKSFNRCDFGCLIIEANTWTEFENTVIENFKKYQIPFTIIVNKIDLNFPSNVYLEQISKFSDTYILVTASQIEQREKFLENFKTIISEKIPKFLFENEQLTKLLNNLVNTKEVCIFVTPIDSGTPKGRLIMPQVQSLRAALDKNIISIVVQLDEYLDAINCLKSPPKLVICDSQVVKEVIELSNETQSITTFSIIFAKMKGDFEIEAKAAYELSKIKVNDKILIAEACSHHSQKDDIAKVKLPKLLEKFCGFSPKIEFSNGRDYPENISEYKLIIHCGACMLTRKEKLNRIAEALNANVAITNFGMAISFLNGYLERVLLPFGLELKL